MFTKDAKFGEAYLHVTGNAAPSIFSGMENRPCEYQRHDGANFEGGLAGDALCDYARGADSATTREQLKGGTEIVHTRAALGGQDLAMYEIYENGYCTEWAIFVTACDPSEI